MEDVSEKRTFQICRNLQDAGCKRTFVTEFLELEQSHSRREQYRLLAKQKAALLKQLHCVQYKIDCLDHMIYIMRLEDAGKIKPEDVK